MSKTLYVGALVATFALLFLCGIPALFLLNSYDLPRGLGIDDDLTNLFVGVLVVLSIAPFIFTQMILTFVVIYKMWSSIQGGRSTRTTPGKAIGFLFIPFFNLYWIFQVWGGFPTDYNRYIEDHSLPVPKLSQGLYVAYPVLVVLCAIPFLGFLLALIATLVFIIVTAKTCDAVNRLADAKERKQMVMP
jgi:hypothetical protein